MSGEALVRTFTIRNRLGLHARAAAVLVALTSRFSSSIIVRKEGFEIDAKSILGILSLAAVYGTEITVTVEGKDSREAMAEVSRLIEAGFGEGICTET